MCVFHLTDDNATNARHQRQCKDLPADELFSAVSSAGEERPLVAQQRHGRYGNHGVHDGEEAEDEEEVF